MCCQFCFEVLCCSVSAEIYFAWLVCALLPLWGCGNAHLWHSVLLFYFYSCHYIFYIKVSGHCYFLWNPFSWVISAWELVEFFCTEGWLWQNSLQELPLTWGLWGQGFVCACSPTDPAGFPFAGNPWRTVTKEWGLTPAAPPNSESALPFPCFITPLCFRCICSDWWLFNLPLVSCYLWLYACWRQRGTRS